MFAFVTGLRISLASDKIKESVVLDVISGVICADEQNTSKHDAS